MIQDNDPFDGSATWRIGNTSIISGGGGGGGDGSRAPRRRSVADSGIVDTGCVIAEEELGQDQRRDAARRLSRGLFRKFSLKVIEWIRKSLELGRNEVCAGCPNLTLFVSSPPHRGVISISSKSAIMRSSTTLSFFVIAVSSPSTFLSCLYFAASGASATGAGTPDQRVHSPN